MTNITLRACVVLAGGSACCAQSGGTLTFYSWPDQTLQIHAISDDASMWIARSTSPSEAATSVWRPGESYALMGVPQTGLTVLPPVLSASGEVIAIWGSGNAVDGHGGWVWRAETGAEAVFDNLAIGAISRNGVYAAGYSDGFYARVHGIDAVAVRSLVDATTTLYPVPQVGPVAWVSDDGLAFGGGWHDGAYRRERDGVVRLWPDVLNTHFAGDGTVVGGRAREGEQARPHLLVGSEWMVIDGINQGPEDFSYAQDVADGGRAVVGMTVRLTMAFEPPYRPWYWSPETGTILVTDLLRQAGLDVGDYSIQGVFAISDDGRTLAGGAWRDVPFDWTYWRATLPPFCTADIGVAGGGPGRDWILDNNDFIAFIDHFFTANLVADRGSVGGVAASDGMLDNNDFVVFIDHFFQGCGR